MSNAVTKKHRARSKRQFRARKKIAGTAARPRLAVFRSNRHISVQLIDDGEGKTLVAASSLEAGVQKDVKSTGSIEAAKLVGTLIGDRAVAAGVKEVVFDRGGNKYHGRVAALADAAREAKLEF